MKHWKTCSREKEGMSIPYVNTNSNENEKQPSPMFNIQCYVPEDTRKNNTIHNSRPATLHDANGSQLNTVHKYYKST